MAGQPLGTIATPSWVRRATLWRQHQRQVLIALEQANPGVTIGNQVYLDVTHVQTGQTRRIIIDALVPQNVQGQTVYQLVDAKFSSTINLADPAVNLTPTLTPNQATVFGWIANGDAVTVVPTGQAAQNANLIPDFAINIQPSVQIHVNSPDGLVIRQYVVP